MPILLQLAALVALVLPLSSGQPAQGRVEVLRPVGAVPAHLASRFDDRALFVQAPDGTTVVLDRRNHAMFAIEARGRVMTQIVEPGWEPGRLLEPQALATGPGGLIAVLDAPTGFDRVQYFTSGGLRVGGFYLPVRSTPRLSAEGALVDAPNALAFTGRTFLLNQPDWGSAFAEFDGNGSLLRQVGLPRVTAHAADGAVDWAMNVGIPVVDPTGGFYLVLQAGVPLFRRYDAAGQLLFERHIEGPELDARLLTRPTTWGPREPGTRPVVPPLVRTAAADAEGRLWVALTVPYTYVYDGAGEKVRTVQFQAAGVVRPSQLFFGDDRRVLVSPGGYLFEG